MSERIWARTQWREGLRDVSGPGDGHTFRIRAESRGSYAVEGYPHHTDSKEFMGGEHVVLVRAWNLPDALRIASEVPLFEWEHALPSDRDVAGGVLARARGAAARAAAGGGARWLHRGLRIAVRRGRGAWRGRAGRAAR